MSERVSEWFGVGVGEWGELCCSLPSAGEKTNITILVRLRLRRRRLRLRRREDSEPGLAVQVSSRFDALEFTKAQDGRVDLGYICIVKCQGAIAILVPPALDKFGEGKERKGVRSAMCSQS